MARKIVKTAKMRETAQMFRHAFNLWVSDFGSQELLRKVNFGVAEKEKLKGCIISLLSR